MLLFGTAKLWLETMPLCMLVVQCVAALVVPNRCQVRARCPRRSPHTARAFRGFFRGCDLFRCCDLLLLLLRLAAARVDGGLGARHLGSKSVYTPAGTSASTSARTSTSASASTSSSASFTRPRASGPARNRARTRKDRDLSTRSTCLPFPCSCSDSGRPRCRRPHDPHGGGGPW